MLSIEESVGYLARETEILGGNLPQCHFVHHKSLMTCPTLARTLMSYGTA
jgi:hypothetical protein